MMVNKRRRHDSEGEEGLDHDAPDSNAQPRPAATSKRLATKAGKAPSKPKTAKKPTFDDSGDDPPPDREGNDLSIVRVLSNAEGEKYVDLGKKKRAAVRSFKGQVYVDIREFYGAEGDEKPGKKGISLAVEQWETLKRSIGTIDSLVAAQGKS